MALSGSFLTSGWYSSSKGDYIYLEFSWTATQSVVDNTSTISWALKGKRTASGYVTSGGFGVVIDGDAVYSKSTSYRIDMYNGTVIASGTKTLNHEADGTRTFKVYTQGAIYQSAVNVTGEQTFTLDTIPRASSITATNANIGSNPIITIDRKATSFTHTLSYSFGSLSDTIATDTSSTKISDWTIPTSFYDEIPNDKSGICTITCETYNGSELVGTSTCTFTATASESECAPTFSWYYATDQNIPTRALTGNPDVLVRYQSTARAAAMAWAQNGAKLVSITAINGSNKKTVTGTGSYETVSMDIVGVDNPKFVFTATDSRGYSSTVTVDAPMINYVNLTCVLTKVQTTVDGDVSFTVSGSYFGGTFGAATNSLNVYYRYKTKGGTYCDNIAITDIDISDNTYTATFSLGGLDYKTTYIFEAGAADQLVAIASSEKTVKFEPVFDWGESDFQFNVPVHMMKNQYYKTDGIPGLDMHNSDIANANGVYFRDACDTNGEGLNFPKSDGVYDRLYVYKGNVMVALDEVFGSGEGVGTVYTVFNSTIKPYYEAGDSVTINTVYAGIVTGSAKNFYFMIPLSKPVLSKKVTLSGKVTGRGINGYVLDSYNNPVDLTKTVDPVSTATITEGGVRVLMEYEATQETGITNNTPINWYGSITLTFSD